MFEALKIATYPARRGVARSLCRSIVRPDHARLSFSAYGEDLIAASWLDRAGVSPADIRYLDVGAAEPQRLNNTFLLSIGGGSGVLVEPDPDQARKLQSARPNDIVLNVGVAFDERRRASLWRLTSRVFNSFLREQAESIVEASKDWEQRQEIIDCIEIELVPLNTILCDHFGKGLHFLSIDAEGTNFDILRSIDLGKGRPKIICIEWERPLRDFDQLLAPFGYEKICQTPSNLVFGC